MTSFGPPPDAPGWQPPPPPGPPGSYPPPPGSGPPPTYAPPPYQGGYPYGPPSAPPGPAPDSNLAAAIFATVLCCVPFGIVAIVFAAQVNSKWAMGDWQGAMDSSRKAKNWAFAAFACGIVIIALAIVARASAPHTVTTYNNSP